MLSPNQRLRRSEDFSRVVRGGRRGSSRSVVVHAVAGGAAERSVGERTARAGFVVSKAVGPAVTRNRVKRRLRHLTRSRLSTLPPNVDLVIRALPVAATTGFAELGSDMDTALATAVAKLRSVTAESSQHATEGRRR